MSDRGEDASSTATWSNPGPDGPGRAGFSGAPTGPLPGPRPPVSGWPPAPGAQPGPQVSTPPYSTPPYSTQPYSSPRHVTSSQSSPFGTTAPTAPIPAPAQPTSPGLVDYGVPSPARPPVPAGGDRLPRLLGLVGFGLGVLLLFVAVIQTVLLAGLSHDLDDARAAQSRAEASAAKERQDLDNLTKRVQGLEERTAGTLNGTAVARKVLPSVFSVRAGNATGTAFAFGQDANGGTLLITNYHVVESVLTKGGRSAAVQRSSESYPVTIERTDAQRDLVVLRASQKFTTLAQASTAVEPGDPVIVVGAPLGLDNTVTTGVVSAIRDDVQGLSTRVIQFDAAINPGNSGGPVINANGQVVGIAQAKIVAEGADGLGLAIPISEVCRGLISC